MKQEQNFTEGKITGPLLMFCLPILFALFLQSLYGAVDLLIVGQFGTNADVCAVSTGSQLLSSLTFVLAAFSIGITIMVGQKIGEKHPEEAGTIIGTGIWLFTIIGIVSMFLVPLIAPFLAKVMNAQPAAFDLTVSYERICGFGLIVIIAYNLIGSIFRGIGDSKTPLITVMIATVVNILGDLLLVGSFHLGAKGAAYATVLAQFVSVLMSILLIRKRGLPFTFSLKQVSPNRFWIGRLTKLGLPMAIQELLVGISFCIILAIVNDLGINQSAGIGVAVKVCGFIMLIPSAFSQAVSAFAAQNVGAGKPERAVRSLWYAIAISTMFGIVMFYVAFFHGDMLCRIFTPDPDVCAMGADYLKAYAIDCLFTCFLFCFIGFFNGLGETAFVMAQGVIASFLVRIPVAYFMSRKPEPRMFEIGLGIPVSTVFQIAACMIFYMIVMKKRKQTVIDNEIYGE